MKISDLRLPIADLESEAPQNSAPSLGNQQSAIENLLTRPPEQRLREYKYRFGQSVVFGLPVIALQLWGGALGPVDAQRWCSLFQAMLAGWVLYVNLGMLVEGIVDRRLRWRGDFLVACAAAALYLYSLPSAVHGIVTGQLLYPLLLHVLVALLAVWAGYRWWRMGGRVTGIATASHARSA